MESFVAEPTSFIRAVAEQTGISLETLRKALKINKVHPYKMQILQERLEDDFDSKIQFCECMYLQINAIRIFLSNICSCDECSSQKLNMCADIS